MYKKVDLKETVRALSNCKIVAYFGRYKDGLINVVIEKDNGERITKRYYFPSNSEYVKFNHKLRELYYGET